MRRLTLALLVVSALAAAVASAPAASSSTQVGAYVPTATEIDVSGCAPGAAGRTDFGTMLPGATTVTSTDCTIAFGASNAATNLRIRQSDGDGDAMRGVIDGALDTGFSGDGYVSGLTAATTGDTYSGVDAQHRVYLGLYDETDDELRLRRYLPDGSLDTSYGVAGTATVGSLPWSPPAAVVLPDGRVRIPVSDQPRLTGLAADGSIEASFGAAGTLTLPELPDAGWTGSASIRLIAPGTLLVAQRPDVSGDRQLALLQIDPDDGTVDPHWGTNGIARIDVPGTCADFAVLDAERSPVDGALFLTVACTDPPNVDVLLVKVDRYGSLDSAFGTGGRHVLYSGTEVGATNFTGLTAAPDGGIYLTTLPTVPSGVELLRIDATSGAPDASWGPAGLRNLGDFGYDAAGGLDIAVDGDGFLIGGGVISGGSPQPALMRVRSDGQTDSTFGTNGVVVLPAPGLSFAFVNGLHDDGTGLLAAIGSMMPSGVNAVRLTRRALSDYAGSWSGGSAFGACLHTVGGATADWTEAGAGNCTTGNTGNWNALPTTDATLAHTTAPGTATANLRFGLRIDTTQTPGAYTAPITFEVIAP